MDMTVTQVWATLQCKTLLLLCDGLASRGVEDELVQRMNNLARARGLNQSTPSMLVANLYL